MYKFDTERNNNLILKTISEEKKVIMNIPVQTSFVRGPFFKFIIKGV